jgi:hypothetical protein
LKGVVLQKNAPTEKVSLDCPFLIALSVLSKVYLHHIKAFNAKVVDK